MMDTRAVHDSKSTNSSDEEIEMTHQQAFVEQAKVLEDMKLLLTTQQASLKQNLDVLQTKATRVVKPKVSKKSSPADGVDKNSHDKNYEINSTTMMSHRQSDKVPDHIDSEHSRQWSHSAATAISGEGIQICPICGMEFDDPENPGALEDHVAGHWCSTDHN